MSCWLSLLLVLVLAPRGFSLGALVFPSPQKLTFTNSNSMWRVFPYCKVHFILIILSWNYALFKFTNFFFFFNLTTCKQKEVSHSCCVKAGYLRCSGWPYNGQLPAANDSIYPSLHPSLEIPGKYCLGNIL